MKRSRKDARLSITSIKTNKKDHETKKAVRVLKTQGPLPIDYLRKF